MPVRRTVLLIMISIVASIPCGETTTPDLEKADLLYESGQYSQAQELYRDIVSGSKDISEITHALFQFGQCLTAQGKYIDAIEVFEGLIKKYPNSKEVERAIYRKGCILAGFLKDVQRGLACFDEILRLYPHGEYRDEASYSIASIHFAKKDYTKAQDGYNKFLKMYPLSPYSKIAKENLTELEKSKSREPVLKGKPIEIVSQNNVHTITRNDTEPVDVAIGDGSVYRFQAKIGGAWKTDMHTHGIWMTSPDGKELVWLSDASGVQAIVEAACPSGGGGGGGCPPPPSCTIGGPSSISPTVVCVGSSTNFSVGTTGPYTECAPEPSVDTSTPGLDKPITGTACCTEEPYTQKSATFYVTVVGVASLLPNEGTEIDDGDGNPDTKTFLVCIAESGSITVTATPNPGVAEADLPSCWTLTGGTGTGKLSRTVSKAVAAETTITCTAGTSSKTTTIKVIQVTSLTICKPTGATWDELPWEQVLLRGESLRIKAIINPAINQLSDFSCEVKVKTSGTNPTGANVTFDTLTGNGTELRATLNPVSLGLLPSNPADGISEFTSSDNASGTGSNFNDSNQFDSDMVTTRTQRGKARNGGSQPPVTEPLTTLDEGGVSKTYMQASGVEYIQSEAHNGTVKSLKKQIENEANYLYYSGHGSHSDGSVALYPSSSFLPSDVGSTEWKEDLGIVFFAGCAVLDINDYNNNYTGQAHNASPGELWAPKGPNLWFGYNWIAPLDDNLGNPNYTASIIHNYFVNRNNGENENWSWGKANKDMASTTDRTVPGGRVYNSCVIDMNQNPDEYWYWKYTGNNPPVWAKEVAPW